ncbi:MAG TPA: HAD-IA family hydrolase [Steroidobacteraceae bacterium]|nr:MAG: HAD family hydrolase [Betaproteobacteria bacterium]HWS69178.1 HAD-IA family hydrolase [Steroidobacteraceae bacterium]
MTPAAAAATRLVLFDLDGTLVDTADDLAAALNRCQSLRGLPPTPPQELRPWTSHGARGLIQRGFGLEPADAGYEDLRAEFLDHYEQALCVHSRLYDGIEQTLAAIEASDRRWGVVTNKPARFTRPLLRALGLERRAACVVSGDTAARPKPDPAPILRALAECRCEASASLYVGDDLRDVQAGRAAGVGTVVAAYGYSASIEDVSNWNADLVIDRPQDLLLWILPP